ncbi:MAG: single-stranded DNA-binding protein [Desulfobacteraceae bacterium]|nr:MAG: single-stranded DNA-binding protein [Desulfobacteraceae bacterium]
MATDMNNWSGVGRLVRDADLKTTQNGSTVVNFSIACGYTYVSNGEKKEQTSFFNCIAWGKTGEAIAQYVKKGHRIGIQGRLQQRTWDAQDGTKRSVVEIIVERFFFLQPKQDDAPAPAPMSAPGEPFNEDEIPF